MGYPMTYKRVVNRNRIAEGSYDKAPVDWHSSGTSIAWSTVENMEKDAILSLLRSVEEHWREAARVYNSRVTALMGDLRRLEVDTVDEGWVCKHIADSAGLDADDVAGVLKAWMAL